MKRRHVFFLVIFIGIWIFLQLDQDRNAGSSYSNTGLGLRALLLTFQELGFTAKPWLQPFSHLVLEETDSIMFIAGVSDFGDVDALLSWVEKGNRLVYLTNFGKISKHLSQRLNFTETSGIEIFSKALLPGRGDAVPVSCPEDMAQICQEVTFISRPDFPFFALPTTYDTLSSDGEQTYLVRKTHGQGDIWLFSGVTSATNDKIDSLDNFRLFFQLASSAQTIYFDEFHHGYTSPVAANLATRQQGVWVFTAFLVFLLVAGALTRAVRFGPPLPEPLVENSATAEFASVLGLLYYDHNAVSVLKHYLTAWRKRLEEKFGISQRLDNQAAVVELLRQGRLDQPRANSLSNCLQSLTDSQKPPGQLEQMLTELEGVLNGATS